MLSFSQYVGLFLRCLDEQQQNELPFWMGHSHPCYATKISSICTSFWNIKSIHGHAEHTSFMHYSSHKPGLQLHTHTKYRSVVTACLPMTESVVDVVRLPNAHMHRAPPGTWNLQKLHWLLKYFGRKLADA